MAKLVRMIAPFEALRGNVSGRQSLTYGSKKSTAWNSGVDKPYATDYNPRFIVGLRSHTGKAYFQVKQKFAAINTAAARDNQAYIAGAKLMYDNMIRTTSDFALLSWLQCQTFVDKKSDSSATMYKTFFRYVRALLHSKRTSLTVSVVVPDDYAAATPGTTLTASIKNPWNNPEVASLIPSDMLEKFWMQLAKGALQFTIIGAGKGLAKDGETYGDGGASNHNNLDLTTETIENPITSESYAVIKYGDFYVVQPAAPGMEYTYIPMAADSNVNANIEYILSEDPFVQD